EATYGNVASFGNPDNNWGRGLTVLPLSNLNLTDAEKMLTQFTLRVGTRSGDANYYIDNIAMTWEIGSSPTYSVQIVEKTPAEKDAILTDALELYIQGMMQACDGKVKSWDIVSDPMDDDNPSELKGDPTGTDFYWQDYLGREYVRKAVRLARKHGGNDLKLFVNDYGLEANADKCKGLTDMVKFWESDGITKIDGIGVRMHMIYSLNPATQKVYEDEVTIMFNSLKESGKLIRISALDMQITDAEGAAMNTANVSVEQQKAMSKYYNFILLKYFEIIQSSQRAGITHWNSLESISYIGLWYGNFDRKYTYIGFADGLAGKETSTE
ncbi:MAG: endo-1,4-beta-xylanase, partial [Tannerella sp.]|nr:endo-1,4-beta-xylanase [Tannerella sp.]